MARSWRGSQLMVLLSVAAVISAQTNGPTPFTSDAPSSTITSAPSSTKDSGSKSATSTDIALSLWSDANSLLTSYYPSTSLTAVNTLTWPSTVVLGSSTYGVHTESAGPTSTSVLAESTGAPNTTSTEASKPLRSDQKLGIVIGVVIGAVVLAILTFIFCLLSRRKKANGTYFLRRASPSIRSESDAGAWRSPRQYQQASDRAPRDWVDSYSRLPVQAAPPMAMHPAYVRQHSSRSTSEDNPFFTPQERLDDVDLDHHELDGAGYAAHGHSNPYEIGAAGAVAGAAAGAPYRRANSWEDEREQLSEDARPPTPFSPMMMMGGGARQPQEYQQQQHYQQPQQYQQPPQQQQHNPFSSPEDNEADDIVSPIIPTRSPERRHSPMVHYPSWSEVSEFDFSGNGTRRSMQGQSSSGESGGDGYHPHRRESTIGRHELA